MLLFLDVLFIFYSFGTDSFGLGSALSYGQILVSYIQRKVGSFGQEFLYVFYFHLKQKEEGKKVTYTFTLLHINCCIIVKVMKMYTVFPLTQMVPIALVLPWCCRVNVTDGSLYPDQHCANCMPKLTLASGEWRVYTVLSLAVLTSLFCPGDTHSVLNAPSC